MPGSNSPKRRRTELAQSIAKTKLALAPQLRGQQVSRRSAAEEVHKHDNVQTPYGPLCTAFAVPLDSGADPEFQCLNPFAFLWHTTRQSDEAAVCFADWLGGRECRLAFYCDGVTPGNALRPDKGRSFQAIYWTFMEFPDWFRSRASHSWFPFAFLEEKQLVGVSGGMAAVARAVVNVFFSADVNSVSFHRTGIIFQSAGADVHFRSIFGCWLADEKAIKEVVSCKGSSGYKPCVCCKNVVNRTTPADGDSLVHISCADVDKFDRQTFESLSYMATSLASKSGNVTQAEFDFLEKAYGLKHTPTAILFDEHCRNIARFPDSIYWDWMHCLLASGGVAQYECNQLLLALVGAGVTLQQADQFCSTVSTPKSLSQLTKTFFQDRVVHSSSAHMKAFASEMLTVITKLGIFVDVVVRPTGVLPMNIACFDHLRAIVGILCRGDKACRDVALLKAKLFAHHEAYLALYSECLKPKLHYVKHTVDCIGRFQCNLSCFGPERRHKDAKVVAEFSYNKVAIRKAQ